MCQIKMFHDSNGNTDIICSISGKPITETGDYGMQCEDRCGERVTEIRNITELKEKAKFKVIVCCEAYVKLEVEAESRREVYKKAIDQAHKLPLDAWNYNNHQVMNITLIEKL